MKIKNLFLLLPLICLILFSCEGDGINPSGTSREIQLNAAIEGLKTLAAGSSWDSGDAIGVYMKKTGEALNVSAPALNVKYETTGAAMFSPAEDSDAITFPVDGSNVDFIGYYPYKEDMADFTYPIDVSNQSVQSDIDFLYSDNAKALNSSSPNVDMLFSHRLSKIALNIEHERSSGLSDMEVIISNVGTKASFDLAGGTLSTASATGDIAFMVASDGATAEAILLPTSDLTGMDLWFILSGDEVYKYPLADALAINAFERSTRYTYNVTLKSDLTAVITEGTISNWIEGPSENAVAGRTSETPPVLPGSKKAPYTVSEAQAYLGKTGMWVKGYIVGSFSGSINNFFPGNTGTSSSNIALADAPGETDTGKMIPVNLTEASATIRNALNIPENPTNVDKMVIIKGDLATYFSVTGLRKPRDYEFP